MGYEARSTRRRLLWGGFAAAIGSLLGRRAAGQARNPDSKQSGEPLTTHMRKGEPPVQPLDSMVVWERGDDNNGRAMTHEVLSLIHQEKGRRSYPWTLYASLETHHEEGDACVVCSRLHKHGPGWSTGLHSEVYNHARAVALGVNVEMSSDYAGAEKSEVIGINVQATGGPSPMQYGIQVHDGQGHFQKAVGLNGKSEVGVDLAGKFGVGVHAHGNTIRVDEGTCIELDGKGQIRLRYHNGRIEFLNGDRPFAHLDVNSPDHAL